jgi:CRISPR-associated exonuclease Cas4
MYSEEDLLPLSKLADFVFCPRRVAFHLLECVWEENVFTAEGQNLHKKTHTADTENRPGIRIVRGLRIHSYRLGLIGQADVVEFHRADTGIPLPEAEGLWLPFPVEYKRGIQKERREYEIQLCAQALCIEEMLKAEIPCGALYYGQSKRRMEIDLSPALRQQTEDVARQLHELIDGRVTPTAKYEKKCGACSLYNRCMPKTTGMKKKVDVYMEKAFAPLDSCASNGVDPLDSCASNGSGE